MTVSNTVYHMVKWLWSLCLLPLDGLHPQIKISVDIEQLCVPNGQLVVRSLGLSQGDVLNLQTTTQFKGCDIKAI